jgi:nitrogen fixation/metabolism regulation signal transduction histidine kinase
MKLADRVAGGDAEMLSRSTQTIINQVLAMKRMVDDFRDYARMPVPELAAVDLNGLIGEVLSLYETARARIDVDLATALPAVRGDATQLRQIIHNLLRNAEDAQDNMPAPRIGIATRLVDHVAEMTVSDDGPGFPPEIMARVFEPYVTTKARGTGLGLAIVKKIVDEHLGRIDIANRQPQGATVRIRLPLAEPAARSETLSSET